MSLCRLCSTLSHHLPYAKPHLISKHPYRPKMCASLANQPNLQALPEELLQNIVECLDLRGLSAFSLTARWCYELAAAVTWREVVLTDCRREHKSGIDEEGREFDGIDDHDDTPLLKKLLVLARSVC